MEQIHNHVRGLSPYPAAWSFLINDGKEETIKIYQTKKESVEHGHSIGKLFWDKKEMKVR